MSELPGRTEVLVVGAGPVGLAVAASLAGHGREVTVVDRQATGANTSRAAVVHARTLEMLERIGVSKRLAGLGIHASQFSIRDGDRELLPVRFDRLPTEYPYTLMVPQNVIELTPAYYAAAGEPKGLWEVPGASHTGGIEARPKEYERRVVAFFDDALANETSTVQ